MDDAQSGQARTESTPRALWPDWFWPLLRPERRALVAVVLLSSVSTCLTLGPPFLTKLLIDGGLLNRDSRVISAVCSAMVAFAVCAALLQAATLRLHTRISGRVLFGLRTHVFAHLLTLSPDWHARHSLGDTLTRLDGDIAAAQRYAVDTLLTALNAVLSLISSVALMLYLDIRLTLVILAVGPVQLLCVQLLRKRVSACARAVRDLNGRLAAFLFDALSTVRFLQLSNAEDLRISQLKVMSDRYVDAVTQLKMAGMASVTVPGLVTTVVIAAVFLFGGHMLLHDTASLGTIVALTAFTTRASTPLASLLALHVSTKRVQINLHRVEALLKERPEVRSPETPRTLPAAAAGRIDFEAVSFTYPLGIAPILRDITLRVECGTKVGIVGRSAAGKSTLVDLLARHYDPQAGTIRLDGVPLPDLSLTELRGAIAVITQDPVIVSGTVTENIAFMRPHASLESIVAAARAAGMHEEISALPSGYDTALNTRGEVLSGGQKQRLALARAFLQHPRVLVLDEATSAVDADGLALLGETLDRLFHDVTRIVISHRPEPLRNIDALYSIDNGRLLRLSSTSRTVDVSRTPLAAAR